MTRGFLSALMVVFIVVACSDEAVNTAEPELRTEAPCVDGVPEYDVTVERHFSAIGPAGNDVIAGDDALWIVESAANTVSRFDGDDEHIESGFVDVGNDRNPYAAAIDEAAGEIWLVNFISDTVTIADLSSGDVVEEISDPGFADPSAVALTKTHAYVANVDFLGLQQGYAPGSIAVIDRSTREVAATWQTEFKNPHFLAIAEVDGAAALFVSGAGAIERSDDRMQVTSRGGLEWFDISTDPVEPSSQTFALGQVGVETVGAAGRPLPTPDGDRLYFSSGIAPVLFVFDLKERRWLYDAAEPLQLYESHEDATHRAAMGEDGLLWVTAFNEDALYLLDTACDELVAPPIDVGAVANMLEGPQALAVVADGERIHGYYLLSIANALGRVILTP